MQVITLEEFKKNSRIEESTEDDARLIMLCEAAEQRVANLINRTWDEVAENWDGIPYDLHQAVLMFADYFYTHPGVAESVQVYEVPLAKQILLFYRRLV